MKSFNLVDEPWISTNVGMHGLRSLFNETQPVSLQGTAIERFCLFRFLIALCQVACPVETEEEWDQLDDDGLKTAVLSYLEKNRALFDLYDLERPFLQYPKICSKKQEKALPIGAYVAGTSSGNTTVVFSNNCTAPTDDATKAKVLLQLCIIPFAGKKIDPDIVVQPGFDKKKSAPVSSTMGLSGLLHTFALGKTFWETLRLAVFSRELLTEVAYIDGVGVPPWECMPQEDDEVARRLCRSYLGHLLPMARFCRIDGERVHVTSGVTMPSVKTGHVDFSVTVGTGADPKTKAYRCLEAKVLTQPWRQLEAILNFCEQKPSWQCLNVQFAEARGVVRGLWCFGVQVTNQSGEQYLSGHDDVIDSQILLSEDFQLSLFYQRYLEEMSSLDKVAKKLWAATNGYFKDCGADDDASERARRAQANFWESVGRYASSLIQACEKDSMESFHVHVCHTAQEIYDQHCPHRTPRQMMAWSRCKPSFAKIYVRK